MIGETALSHHRGRWKRLRDRLTDRRRQRAEDRERRRHVGYRNIAVQIDNLNRSDGLR